MRYFRRSGDGRQQASANRMPDFEHLLQLTSRSALRAELARWRAPLSLPQAQLLSQHSASLLPALKPLRLAVVHTYTSDLLDPWLAVQGSLVGVDWQIHHAPYGLALQEAEPGSALLAHRPDVTLLMLRREDLAPQLATPIVGLGAEALAALRESCLAQLRSILLAFRQQKVGQLLLTLLPVSSGSSLGVFDAQAEASESAWWAMLKAELATWMRQSCPASLLLDLDEVMATIGSQNFFDRRYWFSARFPFTPVAAMEFARRLAVVGELLTTPKAKVLVLDADNTMWGGIVGEDGIDGIAIGPDYPGNAYLEFQRRILDFQQRGLILAMCSKNNAADVDQVLREHPHQLLRDEHFAARRVNWLPKPDNLVSLAHELKLGLDSFIFVDDSDHECAAVRHQLPEVEVIQVPSRAADVPQCLDRVGRLEVLSLTAEDLAKTQLYAQERQRRALLSGAEAEQGSGSYLARLAMKMRIHVDAHQHLARLSQLTRKTNQFNLTTRRYDEEQMRGFIEAEDCVVLDFSLADVFGDSGIVGLAIWRLSAGQAELDTLLMSCRVIGREAESAFLHASLRMLCEQGITRVSADYLPTAKNGLVSGLLPAQGFVLGSDQRYHRDLLAHPPNRSTDFPIEVAVVINQRNTSEATA